MKWNNLQQNKCPKCSHGIHSIDNGNTIACDNMECGFSIGTKRYQEIVRDRIQKNIDEWGEAEPENPDVGDIFE